MAKKYDSKLFSSFWIFFFFSSSFQFFHKNGKPYPVSNKDNITVEISHGGSEVTKTMTLGGMKPEEVNLAQVSFTVHKSGDYTVCIMFSSRHIKGSPFTKKFEAGKFRL